MASGKTIIIGLGSVGFQLLRLLSKDFQLTCIDTRPDILEAARQLKGNSLVTLVGDATSRLVLEDAGAAEADMVVITTTSETINIEVARVLYEHFDVPRVVAIGITQKGIEQLEAYDVEVEGLFAVSAIGLRNRLEAKTKTVTGIGLGKNEILEVEVHPYSRLANKPLSSLNPKSWRIGIIYREGNIVIPRGETILRPKDRIILLGDPKVLKTVADMLTFRFTLFPLEYGDTLVAYIGPGDSTDYLEEIAYLASVYPLERALFLCSGRSEQLDQSLRTIAEKHRLTEMVIEEVPGPVQEKTVTELLQKHGRRAGIVVLSHQAAIGSFFRRFSHGRKQFLRELSTLVGCPVLIAGGSFPYADVAVPCYEPSGLQSALETTLEMTSAIDYRINALFVTLSPYISSEQETDVFDEMTKTVADLGLVYKASIKNVILDGNPIRSVEEALGRYNLMVSSIGSWRENTLLGELFRPDVPWRIVLTSPVSVLLIPPVEALA